MEIFSMFWGQFASSVELLFVYALGVTVTFCVLVL